MLHSTRLFWGGVVGSTHMSPGRDQPRRPFPAEARSRADGTRVTADVPGRRVRYGCARRALLSYRAREQAASRARPDPGARTRFVSFLWRRDRGPALGGTVRGISLCLWCRAWHPLLPLVPEMRKNEAKKSRRALSFKGTSGRVTQTGREGPSQPSYYGKSPLGDFP